jgi:chaperonin GroEL
MIAQAMQKVGNEGVITVEEAKTAETELDVGEACRSTWLLSPYFITNAEKMVAELEDATSSSTRRSCRPAGDAADPRAVVQTESRLLIIAEDSRARLWLRSWSTSCAVA